MDCNAVKVILFVSVFGLSACGGGGGSNSAGKAPRNLLFSTDPNLAKYDQDYLDIKRQINDDSIDGTWLQVSSFEQYSLDVGNDIIVSTPVIELQVYNLQEDETGITMTACSTGGDEPDPVYLAKNDDEYIYPSYYGRNNWPVISVGDGVMEISELLDGSVIESSDTSKQFQDAMNVRLYKMSDNMDSLASAGSIAGEGVVVTCYSGEVRLEKTLALETGTPIANEDAYIAFNVQYENRAGNVAYWDISGTRQLASIYHTVTNIQNYTIDTSISDDGGVVGYIHQPNLFGFNVYVPGELNEVKLILQL